MPRSGELSSGVGPEVSDRSRAVRVVTERDLAELLSAAPHAWARARGKDPEEVCRVAHEHGVLPLLAETRARFGTWPDGPLETRLRGEACRGAARDLLQERALRDVATQWVQADIPVVVIKGAALAYSEYARPDLRPRHDTDLLIRLSDRSRLRELLRASGYEPVAQHDGALVMYQESYKTRVGGVAHHVLDVHWRIANPQPFGDVVGIDDLWPHTVEASTLVPGVRVPARAHALLIACVHLVAHHASAPRLIWLHDIHLLAGSLEPHEWSTFVSLARTRRVTAVCRHSLARAAELFGTLVPPSAAQQLSDPTLAEPTAPYLLDGRTHMAHVWGDLRALGWADRWRLARQHLFPSARYMRLVYAPTAAVPLPFLYAQRVWRGARKWLDRP